MVLIDLSTVLPPASASPDSDIGRLFLSRGWPLTADRCRVLGTREMARRVLEKLPAGPLVLDCSRVDVMSTPFIHELRLARTDVTFEGMNEDVAAAWELVDERLRDA